MKLLICSANCSKQKEYLKTNRMKRENRIKNTYFVPLLYLNTVITIDYQFIIKFKRSQNGNSKVLRKNNRHLDEIPAFAGMTRRGRGNDGENSKK
jgi:hypothetical protein